MFYLIEITTYNDSTPTGKAVYGYETHDETLATFFQKMRGAIVNPNYASELCMIINEQGAVQRYEYWVRQNVAE